MGPKRRSYSGANLNRDRGRIYQLPGSCHVIRRLCDNRHRGRFPPECRHVTCHIIIVL
jgi:hypothetical protein